MVEDKEDVDHVCFACVPSRESTEQYMQYQLCLLFVG
jgi:hypothetical protein